MAKNLILIRCTQYKYLMRLALTGTPGTGKSTVSRIVEELAEYAVVDVNEFAKKRGLLAKKDKKRGSWIVDELALEKELSKLHGNWIIEGHLAHYSKPDIIIVLRLDPGELQKRLEQRGWKKEKVRENIEAEAVGVCLSEALEVCKNVFEIDTTGLAPKEVAEEIINIIGGEQREKYKPGKVDWLGAGFPGSQ